LADHRIDYLHEEGPLTGNRGFVRRIDAGTYATIADKPDAWKVELSGGVIRGRVSLSERSSDSREVELAREEGGVAAAAKCFELTLER
jgi:hypothetical protein